MAFVAALPRAARTAGALRTSTCSFTTRLPGAAARRSPAALPLPGRAYAARALLSEGDKCPAFSAVDTAGNTISDETLRGSPAVLYFMAGAGPGCTQQSCAFRDAAAEFNALKAQIVGVSARGGGASFKDTNGLAYPMVDDADGKLQALFGVPKTLGVIPGRVTFVIDPEGVIRKVFNAQFNFQQHIDISKATVAAM